MTNITFQKVAVFCWTDEHFHSIDFLVIASPFLIVIHQFYAHKQDDCVTYKQWAHTDRTAILSLTSSVQDFIQTTC